MNVVRVLAHRVQFLVQEEQPSGRFDNVAIGTMNYSGHIDVERENPWESFLTDHGMATREHVGNGDTELFATKQFLLPLKPALLALPQGWQEWNLSPDLGME